jgi:hypothetical protein
MMWQAARRLGRQHAKQSASGGHPGKRLLQHADKRVTLLKLPHHEGDERPVSREISAEQHSAGIDSPDAQHVLKEPRRHVQNGDGLAHQRQRRGQILEPFGIARHREMTGPSSRSHPQLGQVHRHPLLQLARPTGSHQGRPRRAATDVDEEAGTIWLRGGAGKRRGSGPRSARRTDGGNENDPAVHRPAGLAKLLLVTAR